MPAETPAAASPVPSGVGGRSGRSAGRPVGRNHSCERRPEVSALAGVMRLWDQQMNFLASELTPDPEVIGSDICVTIEDEGAIYAAAKAQIAQEANFHLTFDPDAQNLSWRSRIGGMVTKIAVDVRTCECGNQLKTTSIRAHMPDRRPWPEVGKQALRGGPEEFPDSGTPQCACGCFQVWSDEFHGWLCPHCDLGQQIREESC